MRLLIALPRTVKILYKFYSYSSTYFEFAPYAWSQMLIFFYHCVGKNISLLTH